jgi:hypothetical protein
MKFDELYLSDLIKDRLTDEMTVFDDKNHNTEFNFDDCDVRVTGRVQQEYKHEKWDYWNPVDVELISRTADFDEIILYYESGVYKMTHEEILSIEKLLDV